MNVIITDDDRHRYTRLWQSYSRWGDALLEVEERREEVRRDLADFLDRGHSSDAIDGRRGGRDRIEAAAIARAAGIDAGGLSAYLNQTRRTLGVTSIGKVIAAIREMLIQGSSGAGADA